MSRTDLIADAFTIIRNANQARKTEAFVPHSALFLTICEILKKEGYLENFAEVEMGNFKQIKVYLRYEGKKKVLTGLKKVSKPGRRVYVTKDEIPSVLHGFGVAIVSTSQGILTDKEAKEKGTGGEVIGMVW